MQRGYASLPLTGPSAAPGREVLLGIAVPQLAGELEPSAAERLRLFVPQRAPLALYGFEAMELVLDAIEAAGGERRAVVRAARATRERSSIRGTDALDEAGLTTLAYGRMAVVARSLAWDLDD